MTDRLKRSEGQDQECRVCPVPCNHRNYNSIGIMGKSGLFIRESHSKKMRLAITQPARISISPGE
jgi:hypothetical protein